MNRLTRELARVCTERLLHEKWLIAPSLRVGHQWLETVTRGGGACVNVRVKTLRGMALELAAAGMAERGVALVSPRAVEIFIGGICRRRRNEAEGYMLLLAPTLTLARTIHRAVDDLRLAGLDADRIRSGPFEVAAKGRELAAIVDEYLEELRTRKLVDYAEALRIAAARLREDRSVLADVLVLTPADIDPTALEDALLDAVPSGGRERLAVDEPKSPAVPPMDAALLRWINAPADAPEPSGDGTALVFQGVGETNEVREVFRLCLAGGRGLDEVELLHTDVEAYVPLVYETAVRLLSRDGAPGELPVTFAEGIPARYSRPGRALVGWLGWMRAGYPDSALARMIQDGLLEIPGGFGFARLAGILRSLGIRLGRERYLARLDEEMASLEGRARARAAGEGADASEKRTAKARERLRGVRLLRGLLAELLELDSSEGVPLLKAALRFTNELARSTNELDNLVRRKLVEDIEEMIALLDREEETPGVDVEEWLAALPGQTRVGGSGPRPGCLHVAHVFSGGHSGRPHTFIVGLDDARFPGAGLQDPVLLDSERERLSLRLRTASYEIEKNLGDFAGLLSRLRGTVTLSFPCRDLIEDRELFPSPVVVNARRILSGHRDGGQGTAAERPPPPASFAPEKPEQCLDETEWWLWRMCGPAAVEEPEAVVARHFPHLGRGAHAAKERERAEFTVYDGRVPRAGADHDPAKGGRVMSASALETIGRCPRKYFFRYVLGIEPPEDLHIDPARWLDPLRFGSLLHEVFHRFMSELLERDEPPVYSRDEARLCGILDEQVEACRRLVPAPSESAFRRQYARLKDTARIFLREEERFCKASRPAYLEAAIGLPPEGEGTAMDTPRPATVTLPDGRKVLIRGRIDRVDRAGDGRAAEFSVHDYKTGSAHGYDQPDPFWQGRIIQHLLYMEMAAARLKEIASPDAKVVQSGYFFTGARTRGIRMLYSPKELSRGKDVLGLLCEIVAKGAFLATDSLGDCTSCDYASICGRTGASAKKSREKLENAGNVLLEAFRRLRGRG